MKIDMRWPDALVARLDERAAATGSNRSELVRRYAEAGLRSDADATPTLGDAPGCGHEPVIADLTRRLADARAELERAAAGPSRTTAARSPFADEGHGQQTCGNGQHGKTTKAGNCERCGQYVGRS